MEFDKLLVLFSGIAGIIVTFWFFLMMKEEVVKASGAISVRVKGGYNPSVIEIPEGQTTTLVFRRDDPNTCLEEVVLGDFKIKKYLPLHEDVSIDITPQKKGVYQFSCGMNMFHGKLIVT